MVLYDRGLVAWVGVVCWVLWCWVGGGCCVKVCVLDLLVVGWVVLVGVFSGDKRLAACNVQEMICPLSILRLAVICLLMLCGSGVGAGA